MLTFPRGFISTLSTADVINAKIDVLYLLGNVNYSPEVKIEWEFRVPLLWFYCWTKMMWAVWDGGSVLIQVQTHCHVLTPTQTLFTLLLPYQILCPTSLYLHKTPECSAPGTLKVHHMPESKGINSFSYGWMLYPPSSCVFSESLLPHLAGRSRGFVCEGIVVQELEASLFLVLCLAFCAVIMLL